MREALECLFPLLQAQLTHRQGDPPLGSMTATVRAASKLLAAAPLSAPHLHIFGICYERHNVTRHVGAPWVSRWRDAGASYTDVPKEQNAYPISRSGHSTASVPWPSSFIEFIRQFSHAAE